MISTYHQYELIIFIDLSFPIDWVYL